VKGRKALGRGNISQPGNQTKNNRKRVYLGQGKKNRLDSTKSLMGAWTNAGMGSKLKGGPGAFQDLKKTEKSQKGLRKMKAGSDAKARNDIQTVMPEEMDKSGGKKNPTRKIPNWFTCEQLARNARKRRLAEKNAWGEGSDRLTNREK